MLLLEKVWELCGLFIYIARCYQNTLLNRERPRDSYYYCYYHSQQTFNRRWLIQVMKYDWIVLWKDRSPYDDKNLRSDIRSTIATTTISRPRPKPIYTNCK